MNMEIWCKSFLSIYNIIPNLVNSIDKFVYLKSVSSSGFSITSNQDTFTQLDNIANLTQKKVNLINLKLLCDETLLELNKEDSKLIILRYIDCLPCEEAIKLSNYTKRTYFRHLQKALKNFEIKFQTKILNNSVLYNNFSNDSFFNDIFEKINTFQKSLTSQKKDVDISSFSNSLCGMILKQIKKAF